MIAALWAVLVSRQQSSGGLLGTYETVGRTGYDFGRTLRFALLKIAFLWIPIDWEIRRPPGLLSPAYLFALPLALWTLVKRPRSFHPAPLLLLVLTLFSAIVYGSPRLRLPYDPLVYALAAGVVAAHLRGPRLWLWAAACLALGLAGERPRLAARAVARALGWW